jgi:hypothetical protein
MRFTKDGVEYVSGQDAAIAFCVASTGNLGTYRKQGLPYEVSNEYIRKEYKTYKSDKYIYPVKKCQKWFAGEE